jgi:hypothetical protein
MKTRFGCDSIGTGAKEIRDLDMQVLTYARAAGGWAAMSAKFVRNGKEWVDVSGDAGTWKTQIGRILEFLGAYRKIMIDYLITTYRSNLESEAKQKRAYESFRGDRALSSLITYEALGSTNPTSDYDVTLCGPGLHCILRHLIDDFERLSTTEDASAHKSDTSTMSFTFDSNFYTGPDVLVKKDEARFSDLQLFYPDGQKGTHNVAIPVPKAHETLNMERKSILKKLERHEGRSIREKYDELRRLTEELDVIAYRGDGVSKVGEEALFELLFKMKETSIEAYHGVSTVLVVVYGMQAGKLEDLREVLGVRHYANACLENLIDFRAHWNEYQTSGKAETEKKIIFIKLSKYLLRIVTCLDEIRRVRKEAGSFFFVVDCLKRQIAEMVKARASGEYNETIDYAAYGIGQRGIAEFGKESGFVHDVYRYIESIEALPTEPAAAFGMARNR